jgi:hypothetical protein
MCSRCIFISMLGFQMFENLSEQTSIIVTMSSSALIFVLLIIIIHHVLGLNRPVSAWSNSLFKGLPSRLRPFGPLFSIILGILLLFILVTCCSQFDLYLLSFSSTGSTFSSSKIFHSFCGQKVYVIVFQKNFM